MGIAMRLPSRHGLEMFHASTMIPAANQVLLLAANIGALLSANVPLRPLCLVELDICSA
jgi:hypothetical protein